jgi:hypothetical protein
MDATALCSAAAALLLFALLARPLRNVGAHLLGAFSRPSSGTGPHHPENHESSPSDGSHAV